MPDQRPAELEDTAIAVQQIARNPQDDLTQPLRQIAPPFTNIDVANFQNLPLKFRPHHSKFDVLN